jgi:hypothetical protein
VTQPDVSSLEIAGDVLAFWHPTDDTPIDETYLPWGPVAPASSADKGLRIKNMSNGYTATDVIIAVADPIDPDLLSARSSHLLSPDSLTFTETIDVGDLAPQAVSGLFLLRRVTDPHAPDGDAGFTITATATAWLPGTRSNAAADGQGDNGQSDNPDAETTGTDGAP